jgi:subtilisin family serine protease
MPKRRAFLIGLLALVVVAIAGGLGWWLAHRPPAGATPTPWPTAPPFTPPPSLDELARLYPEIADLLADTKLGSVYKEFLVAYQQGGLAAAEVLARQRGLLNDQDELRLLLVLDTDNPEPLVAQLQAAGVRVENYYGDLVAVAVPLARIEEAAQSGDPGAALRPLTQLEHVIEIRLPESAVPQAGPVLGEGVAVINADAWHAAGYTGQGVKVAILDSSFEGYEDLLGSELPDRVVYKTFSHQSGVHGAACAEIVHEVAPDAELYLVAYDGEIGLSQAIDWLIAQDVDVVSYSMSWLVGPRDGTSRQAKLVDKAHAAGILWVGSSGNYAQSHYAARFTDTDGDGLHEFSPGQEMMPFFLEEPDEVSIVLNWDDWPRSDQDLDLYLMDAAGDVLASSRDTQSGTQSPAEWIWYDLDAGVYYLVVEAAATTQAVYLDLFITDGMVEQPVPDGSLGTPADARGGLAVGATYWENDRLERFSSQGPTSDGRIKPDLVAPDGVKGVSYGRY